MLDTLVSKSYSVISRTEVLSSFSYIDSQKPWDLPKSIKRVYIIMFEESRDYNIKKKLTFKSNTYSNVLCCW